MKKLLIMLFTFIFSINIVLAIDLNNLNDWTSTDITKPQIVKQLILSKNELNKIVKWKKYIIQINSIVENLSTKKLKLLINNLNKLPKKLRYNLKYKKILDYLEYNTRYKIYNEENNQLLNNIDNNNSIYPSNDLIKNLENCIAYSEDFIHFFNWEKLRREILPIKWNLCNYIEGMPNGWKMECNYTESTRKTIIEYYNDVKNSEFVKFSTSWNLFGNSEESTYTINWISKKNPMQNAINNWECIISGY